MTTSRGDPVSMLERWRDSGADFRVLYLSGDRAIVELRTCVGNPVDQFESNDPRLLEYLRRVDDED